MNKRHQARSATKQFSLLEKFSLFFIHKQKAILKSPQDFSQGRVA